MSAREFILPDLGEGLTEAEVVAWLVQPGDEVAVDQPVVELESAKSVVQLPTPFAGVVESLGGEVGQVLHAGEVLMRLTPVGAAPVDATDDESTTDAAASPDAGRSDRTRPSSEFWSSVRRRRSRPLPLSRRAAPQSTGPGSCS